MTPSCRSFGGFGTGSLRIKDGLPLSILLLFDCPLFYAVCDFPLSTTPSLFPSFPPIPRTPPPPYNKVCPVSPSGETLPLYTRPVLHPLLPGRVHLRDPLLTGDVSVSTPLLLESDPGSLGPRPTGHYPVVKYLLSL